ncbi:MAG: hypothetical protein HQ485_04870 [Acidobacteria bacterium]|nr:hypothetical protein [Acidobacteriota bacterium]
MHGSHARAGLVTGPGFSFRRLIVELALPMAALAVSACGGPPKVVPFDLSFSSKDSAIEVFLTALAARDGAALKTMVVGEAEFKKHIWPSLPASAPEVGMPLDYVWKDTAQKNAGYLARLLDEHGGRHYQLVAASFAGDTSDYGAFLVHRETTLDLRGPGGAATLRLFGSMVESGGRWKIYSFVVN